MTERGSGKGAPGAANPPQAQRRTARSSRLSAALKANLRRRKAQARARAEDSQPHNPAGIVDDKRSE